MKTEGRLQRVVLDGGFGFRKYGVSEKETPSQTQVDDCKQWLLKYAKKKLLPDGKRLNSYYLKELVENDTGCYVTNGAFIQAAIELDPAQWQLLE